MVFILPRRCKNENTQNGGERGQGRKGDGVHDTIEKTFGITLDETLIYERDKVTQSDLKQTLEGIRDKLTQLQEHL